MTGYRPKKRRRQPTKTYSKSKKSNAILMLLSSLFGLIIFLHESGFLHASEEKITVAKKKWEQKTQAQFASNNITDSSFKDFGLPAYDEEEMIVRHSKYTLSYSEEHEQAIWVAYLLKDNYVTGEAERKDDFRPDPSVSTKSSSPSDYAGSGYDRGHLAPAADFKYSVKFMSESFFMSNMSPQAPDFNRGIWEQLESKVRSWVKKDKALYIVTGPVLKDGSFKKIGKTNKVSVPEYYYKVILDYEEPEIKMIAFLMKNEGTKLTIKDFVVTVDEVEDVTGLDFFPALPDSLENALESKKTVSKFLYRK